MPCVLVIDDEELVRLVLRQFLEKHGLDVIEAQDGEDGLRLFMAHTIDLVICDLIMPRADGIATIMNIRKIAPDVKIVAISGGGRSHALELLKVAGQMGADYVLGKPFTRVQILDVVAQSLACSPIHDAMAPAVAGQTRPQERIS